MDANGTIKFTGSKMAEMYAAYAEQVSDALQRILDTTRVEMGPAVDFVSCGVGLHEHFVPKTSLEKHLRKCHGERRPRPINNPAVRNNLTIPEKFYYGRCIGTQDTDSNKEVMMTSEDVQDELQSVVEAKTEGKESSVEGVIGAIQKMANSAGEFYDQVLRWKRIPREFAVMKDNERELVTSAALSRWLNSELSHPGVLPNDEPLDEELVGYVVGLLEHPDFCQPDLLVLELHEFLGSSVTKIVLALWKFMIIEIGLQSLFKAEKTEASNQIQMNFTAKSRGPTSSATASQSQPADATIGRDFKRRRASYRGKVGTKTGPAAFREMIQKHMVGLSVEMDRELVLGGGFQDDVTSDKGPNKAQLKRHAPVNWREFTDALEVGRNATISIQKKDVDLSPDPDQEGDHTHTQEVVRGLLADRVEAQVQVEGLVVENSKPPGGSSTMGSLIFGGGDNQCYLDERKSRRFNPQAEAPEHGNNNMKHEAGAAEISYYSKPNAAQELRDRLAVAPGAVPRETLQQTTALAIVRRGNHSGTSSDYFASGMGSENGDNNQKRRTRRMFGGSGGTSPFQNSVVPQQPLSVVAASVASQAGKAKKNKHHKFNTLVPDPSQSSQTPQSTATSKTPVTANELLSRADLRVQFLKAVKRGDVQEMADVLQRYQQPRPESREDENEEIVNEELVNIRGMWESTPLISATQYAHGEAALWLLTQGADPHASNEKAVTALLLASLEGLTPVVVQLLDAVKAKPDAPAVDKQVGVVYNSAADVNVRLSPLLAASMNGHIDIVRLLLDYGAHVNQQVMTSVGSEALTTSVGGSTALLLGSRYGHTAVVELLLKREADFTLLDGTTDTSALLSACEHGHEECALILLESMTSTKAKLSSDNETEKWQAANRQGFTPLHFAAANGLLRVCKALLSALKTQQHTLEDEVMATAFVNTRAGARRESALLLAVRKRQHEVARLLLEAGADAELADRGGNTATQVLARNKQDTLLQLCEAASKSQRHFVIASPTVEDVLESTIRKPNKEEELRKAEIHADEAEATSTEMFADVDERRGVRNSHRDTLEATTHRKSKKREWQMNSKRNYEANFHKSLKYGIWSTTTLHNALLDQVFKSDLTAVRPVLFFFSVCGTKHFNGVARMTSGVRTGEQFLLWEKLKYEGFFHLEWLLVKDVPNYVFTGVKMSNTPTKKSITSCRDCEEVLFEEANEFLSIFTEFDSRSSAWDDFVHYDQHQELIERKRGLNLPDDADKADLETFIAPLQQDGPPTSS
ncbi:YTH domain-containing family protein 1 [Phytophthora citrophthora]|uniref:YTH domain-containing family protein 1 n=1 Tax=Phytophthora citrophthora TaxID=4793 RepID=A0AAD9LLX1_9STRA|nr:YTH domain-containing family protein 1 [Phytophthora citrophthora]